MIYSHESNAVDTGPAGVLGILKSRLPGGVTHPNLFLLSKGGASETLGGPLCGCLRNEFFSGRHENLQKYFLECDPTTVACEPPVWVESWEFKDYASIFQTRDALTGHIDVLRSEPDGLIGVWDYKPRAAAERNAHIQVFLYALMLALRTGLPLTAFLCGYFDEKDAYVFHPSEAELSSEC